MPIKLDEALRAACPASERPLEAGLGSAPVACYLEDSLYTFHDFGISNRAHIREPDTTGHMFRTHMCPCAASILEDPEDQPPPRQTGPWAVLASPPPVRPRGLVTLLQNPRALRTPCEQGQPGRSRLAAASLMDPTDLEESWPEATRSQGSPKAQMK